MSGTALYFRFLLTNTTSPWRHDTTGTAHNLGVLFGSLWVLWRQGSNPSLGAARSPRADRGQPRPNLVHHPPYASGRRLPTTSQERRYRRERPTKKLLDMHTLYR